MRSEVPLPPAAAPRLRHGVVVHQPTAPVDGLLAQFGLGLRERGFAVSGFVHADSHTDAGHAHLGQGCATQVELFDLARNRTVTLSRASMAQALRQGARPGTDLLVVSRFSAICDAATGLTSLAGCQPDCEPPVLSSIAGRCVHKCHGPDQPEGSIIAPNLAALWRWWGPERLYRDLALGVAETPVRHIAWGQRWILVTGDDGAGLAYLPGHPRDLPCSPASYGRLSLRELAALTASWSPVEMALGVAALNAHYNRFDLAAAAGNGLRGLRGLAAGGGRVTAIGAFPGIGGLFPNAKIIEAEPRPGEYPLAAMDTLVPGSAVVAVNASSLVNRSLPRILRLAADATVALVGPSAPLTPRLHAYGIAVAGGLVVENPAGLAAAVRAGAAPREFTRFARYVHVRP